MSARKPYKMSPERLVSISVEGFKGFEHAGLTLGGLTVVVGTNASGKSNLRDAFRFLHGIGRGYTLAEIVGEKWVEGGVLQWKGLRGGTREVTYLGRRSFSIEARFTLHDGKRSRAASYRIEVEVSPVELRRAPQVLTESLRLEGPKGFGFDGQSEGEPIVPGASRSLELVVRKGPRGSSGGDTISIAAAQPALTQMLDLPLKLGAEVRALVEGTLDLFRSMRFLDLSPDAMRMPSLPGQVVLGDRGENLSSVLQAICNDAHRKRALIEWVRALTPLDVSDLRFPVDQTGRILVALVEEGGRETSAYSASDGTLRFLAIVAAFLGPDPARCYFFEELDNGLHPTRLHLLLDLIERQVQKGTTQVVASTHSPPLLAFLGKEAIESAVLAYRLPGTTSQRLRRIVELPDVRRVLEHHDVAELHRTGWLENAVFLSDDGERTTREAAE